MEPASSQSYPELKLDVTDRFCKVRKLALMQPETLMVYPKRDGN